METTPQTGQKVCPKMARITPQKPTVEPPSFLLANKSRGAQLDHISSDVLGLVVTYMKTADCLSFRLVCSRLSMFEHLWQRRDSIDLPCGAVDRMPVTVRMGGFKKARHVTVGRELPDVCFSPLLSRCPALESVTCRIPAGYLEIFSCVFALCFCIC